MQNWLEKRGPLATVAPSKYKFFSWMPLSLMKSHRHKGALIETKMTMRDETINEQENKNEKVAYISCITRDQKKRCTIIKGKKKILRTLICYFPSNKNKCKTEMQMGIQHQQWNHNEGSQGSLPVHSHLHWSARTHFGCENQRRVVLRCASLTALWVNKCRSQIKKPQLKANNILLRLLPPVAQRIRFRIAEEGPVQQASQESQTPHKRKATGSTMTLFYWSDGRKKPAGMLLFRLIHKPSLTVNRLVLIYGEIKREAVSTKGWGLGVCVEMKTRKREGDTKKKKDRDRGIEK